MTGPTIESDDAALDALFRMVDSLDLGGRPAAFLRARAGAPLAGRALSCEQGFKPEADRLAAAGFAPVERLDGRFALVLLLPGRQTEEVLADFARGLDLLEPGGSLVCAMPNALGGARFARLLGEAAGGVDALSKRKCRAFRAVRRQPDPPPLDAWRALGALRPGPEGRFLTRPGLFSWDRVDPGSRLLAETLPPELAGRVADLGAGWGWLADAVLRRCPAVRALDLYEADRGALDAARRNLDGAAAALAFRWHDVTAGLPAGLYDAVVTNPPFHEGRAARPELGQAFIAAAAGGLRRGGRLWLVANRNLPYERTLSAHLADIAVAAERDGFKVLTGRRA